MPAPNRHRLYAAVATVAVLGGLVGAVAALISDSPERIFLTDTVSYVPAEAWWLHGLVFGATLGLLVLAMWSAQRFAGVLFVRGLLFPIVGVFITAMGALMIGLALTLGPDSLDDGQRTMFGWIAGPIFLALGALMLWAALAPRRKRSKR